MDHEAVERIFTYAPEVGEELSDTQPLELITASALCFAHDLVDNVPGRKLHEAIVALQRVVHTAAEGIRADALRKDRARALAEKAAHP